MRRLVPAAILGACGFLDNPERPGRVVRDGLGGFDPPQALELCRDTARLVGAAVRGGAAGFCVTTQAAPRGCAGDRACGPRERCVCGRCTVAVCLRDADCGGGEICAQESFRCATRCGADGSCPAGERCRSGVCVRECKLGPDCARGEQCDAQGRCVVLPCTNDTACGFGERCDLQREAASVREPSALPAPVGGGRWLYVELGGAVFRAVSRGPSRFVIEPAAPVLRPGPGDGDRLGAPSVARVPGGYVLAAARGADAAIVAAKSLDGVTFGAPAVVLEPEEDWEGRRVGSPALRWWRDRLVMAYTGRGGIGLATLALGDGSVGRARRVRDASSGTARVMDPARVTDPVLWRAVDSVEGPDLVPVRSAAGRDLLRMYFAARGAESSATEANGRLTDPPVHWSIGVAAADATLAFQASPFDPVLTRVAGLGAVRDAREPAVLEVDGAFTMYLRGEELDGGDEGILVTGP